MSKNKLLMAVTLAVLAAGPVASAEKKSKTKNVTQEKTPLEVKSVSPAVTVEPGQTMTFTVDKAVDFAMANSRTLKSADIDLEIKRRAAAYSWNVFLPTVTASGTLSRANNVDSTLKSMNGSLEMANKMSAAMGGPTTPLVEETESLHWTAIGNLNVSLNLSLAYIEQIKAAKSSYEGGQLTWGKTRRETITNVKKLFYGLLLQQEDLRIKKNTLENARRRAVQSRINFENGSIPELRYLQASVSYENNKPEVADAERLLNQQLDMFAFMLGLPVGTKIELVGDIRPTYVSLDADDLITRYGSGSLDVRSLNNSIATMQSQLRAANLGSYTPGLSLGWNYNPMHTDAFDSDWFDSDKWSDSGAFSATFAWKLTDMLPFSSSRQQAQDLKSQIAKLEISMQTLLEDQKVKVRKSVDVLTNAREQIEAMRRNINLAQRSYDLTYVSYENGTTELLELRDTESQLYQAQLGLANQKYNYISALLDLENTLNAELAKDYIASLK